MSACLLVTHSPTAGVSYSVRRILSRSFDDAIVMQIVTCHSHVGQKSVLLVTDQSRSRHQRILSSPSAKGAHQDPSSHRSAQIHAYSARRLLHGAKELTEILLSVRNAMAQPGRSWLCRREALLPSTRLYRMKGMPRAGLHCGIYRGSIAMRIVMVRRREEGAELSSCSYLIQCDVLQRNNRRRDSQEYRIQSGRSRVLASNWSYRQGFQLRQGRRNSCRNPPNNCRTVPCCAVLHEQYLAQGKYLAWLYDGCMLMRSAKRCSPGFVLSFFGPFETVQNLRSTATTEQCCASLSMTSCGREELNECLTDRYVLAYDEVEVAKFGEAPPVVWRGSFKQGSRTGPTSIPDLQFPILASGSRSRGAQTGPCPLTTAHLLLSLAHPQLRL